MMTKSGATGFRLNDGSIVLQAGLSNPLNFSNTITANENYSYAMAA